MRYPSSATWGGLVPLVGCPLDGEGLTLVTPHIAVCDGAADGTRHVIMHEDLETDHYLMLTELRDLARRVAELQEAAPDRAHT